MTMPENRHQNCSSPSRDWFAGFDWLRFLFITCVVSMHLNLTQQIAGAHVGVTLSDIVYYQFFCTAVPGFLFIAVFLQFVKNPDPATIWNHLVGCFYLYAFWVGSWILLTRVRPSLSLGEIILFLLQGGGWAFYFFTHLILVHLLRIVIRNWSNLWLAIGFVLSELIIALIFRQLAIDGHSWMQTPTYWWPICALPIPFAAGILARKFAQISNDSRLWVLLVSLSIFIACVAAVWEWSLAAPAGLEYSRPFLPEYLRLSPMFLAVALVVIALRVKSPPKWIRFLSRNALGIFCLHVFVLSGVYKAVSSLISNPVVASMITLVLILGGLAWLAEFVRKMFQSRLV